MEPTGWIIAALALLGIGGGFAVLEWGRRQLNLEEQQTRTACAIRSQIWRLRQKYPTPERSATFRELTPGMRRYVEALCDSTESMREFIDNMTHWMDDFGEQLRKSIANEEARERLEAWRPFR